MLPDWNNDLIGKPWSVCSPDKKEMDKIAKTFAAALRPIHSTPSTGTIANPTLKKSV
jgi:hypothetical protein